MKRLAWRASVYFIWKVWNEAIFQGVTLSSEKVLGHIHNSIQCGLLGLSSKWREKMLMRRNPLLDRWSISLVKCAPVIPDLLAGCSATSRTHLGPAFVPVEIPKLNIHHVVKKASINPRNRCLYENMTDWGSAATSCRLSIFYLLLEILNCCVTSKIPQEFLKHSGGIQILLIGKRTVAPAAGCTIRSGILCSCWTPSSSVLASASTTSTSQAKRPTMSRVESAIRGIFDFGASSTTSLWSYLYVDDHAFCLWSLSP